MLWQLVEIGRIETENSISIYLFRELRTWSPNFISSIQRLFYGVVVIESDGPCRLILTLATAQSELGLLALKQSYTNLNYDPCQNGSHVILLAPAAHASGKRKGTNALFILLNNFQFMRTVLKTGNINVQLVLQHCCKTSWIAMLRVLPPKIKPVLQQIRLLQVA